MGLWGAVAEACSAATVRKPQGGRPPPAPKGLTRPVVTLGMSDQWSAVLHPVQLRGSDSSQAVQPGIAAPPSLHALVGTHCRELGKGSMVGFGMGAIGWRDVLAQWHIESLTHHAADVFVGRLALARAAGGVELKVTVRATNALRGRSGG